MKIFQFHADATRNDGPEVQRFLDDGHGLCDLPPGRYLIAAPLFLVDTQVMTSGMKITGLGGGSVLIEIAA